MAEDTQVLALTAREQDLTAHIEQAQTEAETAEAEASQLTESLREVAASSSMSGAGVDPLKGLDTGAFDDEAKAGASTTRRRRRRTCVPAGP